MEETTILLGGTLCVLYTTFELLRLVLRASTPGLRARRSGGQDGEISLRMDRRDGSRRSQDRHGSWRDDDRVSPSHSPASFSTFDAPQHRLAIS